MVKIKIFIFYKSTTERHGPIQVAAVAVLLFVARIGAESWLMNIYELLLQGALKTGARWLS